MRKTLGLLICLAGSVFISGCNDNDEVKQISKEGAIETVLNVNHLDQNHDIIITTHNVWIKNELVRKVIHCDTVPALGKGMQDFKNFDGDTKSISSKKEYEIYITVK
jgi:hypothetical protein